jgi:hypothetical protein
MHVQLGVDQVQEFLDIAQQLLTDAFAGAVDAELHARGAEEDRGRKQAHRDGLPDCGVGVLICMFFFVINKSTHICEASK